MARKTNISPVGSKGRCAVRGRLSFLDALLYLLVLLGGVSGGGRDTLVHRPRGPGATGGGAEEKGLGVSAEGTAESRYAQPLMFSTIFSFTLCLGGGGVSALVSLGGRWLAGWAWRWHYFTAFSGGTLGQSTRGGIALASRLTRGRLRSLPSASLGFPVPTDSLTSSLSRSLSLAVALQRLRREVSLLPSPALLSAILAASLSLFLPLSVLCLR